MTEMIYLVQIGPVQSFIASARKVQDLAVGSTLLSRLARAGVVAAEQHGEMLFPVRVNKILPNSVPHRFAFISSEPAELVSKNIEDAIEGRWKSYTNAVRKLLHTRGKDAKIGDWQGIFDKQVTQWPNIVWAAVPYTADHAESYERVNLALVARKQFRAFAQVDVSETTTGVKCTQTGSQLALPLNFTKLDEIFSSGDGKLFRPNEHLGSLASIKRLLPYVTLAHFEKNDLGQPTIKEAIEQDIEQFENLRGYTDVSTISGGVENEFEGREAQRYFAVLHLDGDKMGEALGELKTKEEHQDFSALLNNFSDNSVDQITRDMQVLADNRKERLIPIYAGGDDVLALAPVNLVLRYAEELRLAFARDMKKYNLHASAGISINYHKAPLDIALDAARDAESTAKKKFGRNAVTIRESTHSGNIRDTSGKWQDDVANVNFIDFMDYLRLKIQQGELSTKIGFDLREFIYDLVETEQVVKKLAYRNDDDLNNIINNSSSDEVVKLAKLLLSRNNPTEEDVSFTLNNTYSYDGRRFLEEVIEQLKKEQTLPNETIKKWHNLLQDLLTKEIFKAGRKQEVKRLLNRHVSDHIAKIEANAIHADLTTAFTKLGESKTCGWESLANRVIMARFLAQEDK